MPLKKQITQTAKENHIQTNKDLLKFQSFIPGLLSCQGYFSVEIHNLQSD